MDIVMEQDPVAPTPPSKVTSLNRKVSAVDANTSTITRSAPTITTTAAVPALPHFRIASLSTQYSPSPIANLIASSSSSSSNTIHKSTSGNQGGHMSQKFLRIHMWRIAAQLDLATMQKRGEGDPKDFPRALECYLKAVNKGHAYAQFSVGRLYLEGKEVSAQWSGSLGHRTRVWLRHTMRSLTFILEEMGVLEDYGMVMEWYVKAGDQGFVPAQHSVAFLYLLGLGVPQDYVKAGEWFRKAADSGFAVAQVRLGHLHRDGLGVSQDYSRVICICAKERFMTF